MALQLRVLLHIFGHVWVLGWLALDKSCVVKIKLNLGFVNLTIAKFGGSHKDGDKKQQMTTRKEERLC